jgi:2-keto-4-pentenoate hydratase
LAPASVDGGRIATAAALLAEARRTGRPIDALPEAAAPRDVPEALAIQDALAKHIGGATIGWKIGATQRGLQAKLGLAEPFYGRIFAGTVRATGCEISGATCQLILEAELAVRLARNFDPSRADWSAQSVAIAVDDVVPCIEINRPSFRNPFAMRGIDVIADNGSNAGLVLGAPIADWRRHDLAAIAVVFRISGVERASGIGANVMGHPLDALAWLANDRARRGTPLAGGDIVATGSLMGFVAAKPGDVAEADFAGHGIVRCAIVG